MRVCVFAKSKVSRGATGQAPTKCQKLDHPEKFLSVIDWPQTIIDMGTTMSVVVSRLRKGGLHHPSEATIKVCAAFVACCHYPDSAPDPDEALRIVRELKTLFHARNTMYIDNGPETWPAGPSDLPAEIFAAMYPDGEGPEPRVMNRLSWMTAKIVLRRSNKSVNKLPVAVSGVSGTDATSNTVLQFMELFMQSQRGRTAATPGVHIEELATATDPQRRLQDGQSQWPRSAGAALALGWTPPQERDAPGALGTNPRATAGAGGSSPALGGAAPTGVAALLDPCGAAAVPTLLAADVLPGSAVDAVAQMEAAAAGGKGAPAAAAASMEEAAAGGKGAKAIAKKPAAHMGKKPVATTSKKAKKAIPGYREHYNKILTAHLKKKMNMTESHAAARKACDIKFKLV